MRDTVFSISTKTVLGASAVVMGSAGIVASFIPHEILSAMDVAPAGLAPIIVQMLGALLIGFAMVNWTARGSLIGGIYNRPVVLGNVTHFIIGALALSKAAASDRRSLGVYALATVYIVFAVAFALILFRSPIEQRNGK